MFLDRFKKGAGLLCPRCEEPLELHDDEKCANKMTRRHFVGMWGAAVAIAYGVRADGKPNIVLATPTHMKRLEKEMRDSEYMVSARNGYVVTSRLGGERSGRMDGRGGVVWDTKMQEVLKLRAKGFHVKLHQDEHSHRLYAAHAAWLPEAQPDSEFPSVERW